MCCIGFCVLCEADSQKARIRNAGSIWTIFHLFITNVHESFSGMNPSSHRNRFVRTKYIHCIFLPISGIFTIQQKLNNVCKLIRLINKNLCFVIDLLCWHLLAYWWQTRLKKFHRYGYQRMHFSECRTVSQTYKREWGHNKIIKKCYVIYSIYWTW